MERKTKEFRFGVQVKALIFDQNENILTLKRIKNGKDEWDLPGGQVQFGENVYNTVWRVVKEQTDLDVEIEGPSNVWTIKMNEYLHTICITFRCTWFPSLFSEDDEFDVSQEENDDNNKKSNYNGDGNDDDDDDDDDQNSEDDVDDDPIFLSNDFDSYEWVSPEDILDGDFPVWMKDEIKIIEED